MRGPELNKERIIDLVSKAKYFVLHEQRQSGKTTFLLELRDYLNSTGQFAALYVNIEAAQQGWSCNLKLGVETVVVDGGQTASVMAMLVSSTPTKVYFINIVYAVARKSR